MPNTGGLSFLPDEGLVWEYIDKSESEFLYQEIFINNSYVQHGVTVRDDSVIVDAGANIGIFSLYCLSKAKNIELISVEPIPVVFNVLRRNLMSYQQSNRLHLINAAIGCTREDECQYYYISSAPGESTRHIDEWRAQKEILKHAVEVSSDYRVQDALDCNSDSEESCHSASEHNGSTDCCLATKRRSDEQGRSENELKRSRYDHSVEPAVEICRCPVRPLREILVDEVGSDWHVDLLKIDVEGDELDLLESLLIGSCETSECQQTDILSERIRQIVAEVHDTSVLASHSGKGRLAQVVEFLEFHGYSVTTELQTSQIKFFIYKDLRHEEAASRKLSKLKQLPETITTTNQGKNIFSLF